jgi:calcineurin-like phosphoesterase family protein
MTTWFTSDLHIGHKNIIKYCQRPWRKALPEPLAETGEVVTVADVHAMDEALVANWNSAVKPDDTVWNLGDFAFTCSPGYANEYFRRLHGVHNFVMGNHDNIASIFGDKAKKFASWTDGYVEVTVTGQTIVLCHYAMREWHHALQGTWHRPHARRA